ncbi:MAG: hypothetical protein EBX67_11340, partial [Betaproteobacteria bacterium]|nr:hypothetical protein [Betaproteobacteria bacterium]
MHAAWRKLLRASHVTLLVFTLAAATLGKAAAQPSSQGSNPAINAIEMSIKQSVESWLKGKYKVDGIAKTPIAGL